MNEEIIPSQIILHVVMLKQKKIFSPKLIYSLRSFTKEVLPFYLFSNGFFWTFLIYNVVSYLSLEGILNSSRVLVGFPGIPETFNVLIQKRRIHAVMLDVVTSFCLKALAVVHINSRMSRFLLVSLKKKRV